MFLSIAPRSLIQIYVQENMKTNDAKSRTIRSSKNNPKITEKTQKTRENSMLPSSSQDDQIQPQIWHKYVTNGTDQFCVSQNDQKN